VPAAYYPNANRFATSTARLHLAAGIDENAGRTHLSAGPSNDSELSFPTKEYLVVYTAYDKKQRYLEKMKHFRETL
jgi:hypothetical protein